MCRARILCISTGEVWNRNSSRGCCCKPSYEKNPGFSKECETGGAFTERFAAKWKFCYMLLPQLKPKEDDLLPSVYQLQRRGMFGERSTEKANFWNMKQEPEILPMHPQNGGLCLHTPGLCFKIPPCIWMQVQAVEPERSPGSGLGDCRLHGLLLLAAF